MALENTAISPAALAAGNNNDYAGFTTKSFARLTPNAGGSTLTGLANGADGRALVIVNLGAAALTISHENVASAAANRIRTLSGLSLVLATGDVVNLQYDSTTARWRQIAPSLANVNAPSLDAFSVYDNTGGQSFTVATITVNLDTVKKNSDATNFSIAADEVTIQEAGYYLFEFQVTCQETAGAAGDFTSWLEVGGVEVDGTRAFGGGKFLEDDASTVSMSIVMDVTAAQVFRVRAARSSLAGTFTTVADASRLTIVKLGS